MAGEKVTLTSSPHEVAAGTIRLHILGPLQLWRGETEVDPGPRQQATLLAILAARADQSVGRSELVDLIWDDGVPDSAINIIHKYVGSLRRLLEPGLPARAHGSYLQSRSDGYFFRSGNSSLDLLAFRSLVREARAALAIGREQIALDRFVQGLGLWRGSVGGDLAHGLRAEPLFVALDNEYFEPCLTAADLALRRGQPQLMLPALRHGAAMAPLNEDILAALAITLSSTGQRAEALALLRAVRTRLAEELGVDPGPALCDAQRRILGSELAPGASTVNAHPQPTRLVGRRTEFEVLRRLVGSAQNGAVGVATVDGEPGVGKTHLLRAAGDHAVKSGMQAVWGTCVEGDGAPSMWPWIKVVGSLIELLPIDDRAVWRAGEIGRLMEPTTEDRALPPPDTGWRFRLFDRVVALTAQVSARQPVVLVVDDLQWADVASLELFGHLAARLPGRTILIGALRDRAPTPGTALSRILADVSRVAVHRRIHLGAMNEAEVAELVQRDTGLSIDVGAVRSLLARTSGNPFFVREIARLLTDTSGFTLTPDRKCEVPATVHDIVRTRTSDLSEEARRLLETAALVGRTVEISLLAETNGLTLSACLDLLEPLAALGVLESTPGDPCSVRFAHDLVRESIVHVTPPRRAIDLHLRVANALEGGTVDDGSAAERLAYHLTSAGPLTDPERTSAALLRAGHSAVAKSAFESAQRHLLAAIDTARKAGLAEVELSAAAVLATVFWRQLGFSRSYLDLLTRAEQLARRLGHNSNAADFLFMRVVASFSQHQVDTDVLVRRLVAYSETSGDSTARMYARQITNIVLFDQGDFGGALEQLREDDWTPAADARWAKENPLRRDLRMFAPLSRALTLVTHGDIETARILLQAVEDAAGDEPYAISVWAHWATTAASWAGDPSWALRAVDRWRRADPHHLFVVVDSYLRVVECWTSAMNGEDPASAADQAAHVIERTMLDPPLYGTTFYLCLLADMWLAAEHPDRASRVLQQAERFAETNGERYTVSLRLLMDARLLHAEGASADLVSAAAERAHKVATAQGAAIIARRARGLLGPHPA
jgi:DNA-binding SARP family transcriptional activator